MVPEGGEASAGGGRTSPRVRGGLERSFVAYLREESPHYEAIVAASPEGLIDELENCSALAWLPYERAVQIHAIHLDIAGRRHAVQETAAAFMRFTDGAMMRALSATLVNIFGVHGHQVHRVYPRIWSAFTRGFGKICGEQIGEQNSKVYFEEAPVWLDRYDALLATHEAALNAMFIWAEMPGHIACVGEGADAHFIIGW